ncbi:hypothetical protein EYC84_008305 [Monilinia fructicola]|nr:hypothetical protein EYC84_008305 [Monilinia fructicola]
MIEQARTVHAQVTSSPGVSVPGSKPISPRLLPLGSPGPITPFELEESSGYLIAGQIRSSGLTEGGLRENEAIGRMIRIEEERRRREGFSGEDKISFHHPGRLRNHRLTSISCIGSFYVFGKRIKTPRTNHAHSAAHFINPHLLHESSPQSITLHVSTHEIPFSSSAEMNHELFTANFPLSCQISPWSFDKIDYLRCSFFVFFLV